jgi:hypothetical protein
MSYYNAITSIRNGLRDRFQHDTEKSTEDFEAFLTQATTDDLWTHRPRNNPDNERCRLVLILKGMSHTKKNDAEWAGLVDANAFRNFIQEVQSPPVESTNPEDAEDDAEDDAEEDAEDEAPTPSVQESIQNLNENNRFKALARILEMRNGRGTILVDGPDTDGQSLHARRLTAMQNAVKSMSTKEIEGTILSFVHDEPLWLVDTNGATNETVLPEDRLKFAVESLGVAYADYDEILGPAIWVLGYTGPSGGDAKTEEEIQSERANDLMIGVHYRGFVDTLKKMEAAYAAFPDDQYAWDLRNTVTDTIDGYARVPQTADDAYTILDFVQFHATSEYPFVSATFGKVTETDVKDRLFQFAALIAKRDTGADYDEHRIVALMNGGYREFFDTMKAMEEAYAARPNEPSTLGLRNNVAGKITGYAANDTTAKDAFDFLESVQFSEQCPFVSGCFRKVSEGKGGDLSALLTALASLIASDESEDDEETGQFLDNLEVEMNAASKAHDNGDESAFESDLYIAGVLYETLNDAAASENLARKLWERIPKDENTAFGGWCASALDARSSSKSVKAFADLLMESANYGANASSETSNFVNQFKRLVKEMQFQVTNRPYDIRTHESQNAVSKALKEGTDNEAVLAQAIRDVARETEDGFLDRSVRSADLKGGNFLQNVADAIAVLSENKTPPLPATSGVPPVSGDSAAPDAVRFVENPWMILIGGFALAAATRAAALLKGIASRKAANEKATTAAQALREARAAARKRAADEDAARKKTGMGRGGSSTGTGTGPGAGGPTAVAMFDGSWRARHHEPQEPQSYMPSRPKLHSCAIDRFENEGGNFNV